MGGQPSIPVLSPSQAALWDQRAVASGIPLRALMECAGRGVAGLVAARYADRLRHGVLVAIGPGHNGGDGWVAAHALHAAGVPVWAAPSGASPRELTAAAAALARGAGVRELAPDGPWPNVGLVLDAILGTGAQGAPRDGLAPLLSRLADLDVPVIAVDGPTGLDLGNGVQHGPLRAALTITFGGYRRGHLLARDEVGDLAVLDIGLPPPDPSWPVLFPETAAARELTLLPSRAHKGTRGRVVVVGGDEGMLGAARLAARAAFAAGAGLVHLVAPAASTTVASSAEPDLQTMVQPFEAMPAPRTTALLGQADAAIIGPGLGRRASRPEFVLAIVAALPAAAAIVLDADGLMAFAGQGDRLREALAGRRAILTPHAGEFRALVPDLAADLVVDPWGAAGAAAGRLGALVLLKGVPTVVATPTGEIVTIAAGNPGLATGGSGDTLSGLIGGLAGGGIALPTAAHLGAVALGEAGDFAARRMTARSMRPMDVLAAIPDVWRRWHYLRTTPPRAAPPVLHELAAPIRV